MRLIKMMGIAAVLALAAMAITGASAASAATLKAEACITKTGECKELLANDTFTAHGTKVELEGLGIEFKNVCLSTITGKMVTATGLATAPAKLEADITAATFTKNGELEPCSFAVLSSNLPWRLLTDAGTTAPTNFPSGTVDKVLVTLHAIGECQFQQSGVDQIKLTWLDGTPSVADLGGSMVLKNGNPFCPSLGHIRGSYKVSSVTAADIVGEDNVRILKE